MPVTIVEGGRPDRTDLRDLYKNTQRSLYELAMTMGRDDPADAAMRRACTALADALGAQAETLLTR